MAVRGQGLCRSSQWVVELLIAVAEFTKRYVVDVTVLVREVGAVDANSEPFMVVFDSLADSPAWGIQGLHRLTIAQAQYTEWVDHVGNARFDAVFIL